MPPHQANVPSCSTVWSLKPSSPTQLEVYWSATPEQVTEGWTKVECTYVHGFVTVQPDQFAHCLSVRNREPAPAPADAVTG